MQPLKKAESHKPQENRMSGTLVQRILHWSPPTEPPRPSNSDQFDDSPLDERVRESGEW